MIAISRGRGGVDHALDIIVTGGNEDVDGTADAMVMSFQRVGDTARDRRQRRLMQRVVDAAHDPLQFVEVSDAADGDRQVAIE